MNDRPHLSIGEVLSLLQDEFPDITISKIRFLESQGLLDPERTPSGYRKFYEPDLTRLRWILTQQRDHFLPLRVIKERLDSGLPVADLSSGPAPASAASGASGDSGASGASSDAAAASAATAPPEPSEAVVPNGPVTGRGTAREPRTSRGARAGARLASPIGDTNNADNGRVEGGDGDEPGDPTAGATAARPTSGSVDEPGTAPRGAAAPGARNGPPPGPVGEPADHDGPEPMAVAGGDAAEGSDSSSTSGANEHVEAAASAPSDPAGRSAAGSQLLAEGSLAAGPSDLPPTPGPQAAEERAEPGDRGGDAPERSPSRPAEVPPLNLTLSELSAACGQTVAQLNELERYGLIAGERAGAETVYGEDALTVARLAARFGQHGIEPRHLRQYRVAAEREVALVEQVVTPYLVSGGRGAPGSAHLASGRRTAHEAVEDLTGLGEELRRILVERGVRDALGPV